VIGAVEADHSCQRSFGQQLDRQALDQRRWRGVVAGSCMFDQFSIRFS
jgi:hypothetical protein